MSQQLKLLLVDDEPQQRAVVRFLLRKSELEADITEAGDVASALAALLKDGPFDCAIVDFSLTDGTALDLLHKASARGLTTATPIVILTSEEDEAVDVATSQAGADDFLLKFKLDPETLRRVIRRAIERHRRPATVPAAASATRPDECYGRFVRKERVGSGGMCEVWKAWDSRDDRWVALKILRPGRSDDALRLAREGVAIAQLSHPNIAKIYDIGRERDQTYIAMEYIVGETLDEFARVETRLNVHGVREAALAIHYAHGQGVIHRDIKPSNIMVSGDLPAEGRPFDAARVHIYVMDFGIVKLRHNLQTTTNVLVGTPGYMSPEHVKGMEVDARSDVYSLGATLYHLLAGFPAFDSDDFAQVCHAIVNNRPRPLRNIDPAIDPRLAAIVDRCLEKKPEFRYPTALEMAGDLEAVQKDVQ